MGGIHGNVESAVVTYQKISQAHGSFDDSNLVAQPAGMATLPVAEAGRPQILYTVLRVLVVLHSESEAHSVLPICVFCLECLRGGVGSSR